MFREYTHRGGWHVEKDNPHSILSAKHLSVVHTGCILAHKFVNIPRHSETKKIPC